MNYDDNNIPQFAKEMLEKTASFEKTASISSEAQRDIDKYGLAEPSFQTVDLKESTSDKVAMLSAEKETALGMVKIAAFDGRLQDPYPSPFLNLSDTQIPRTTTEIFRWCKYFYMFDPLISGSINALATFPVTDLNLEELNKDAEGDDSPTLKTYEKVLFKTLNIHKLLIEIGIDYFLYGNCFIFGEMWTNPDTGETEWKTMTRLDPSKMIIDYNPATQEKKYKWQVPAKIAEIVKKKKPVEEYNKIPNVIKQAVKKNQAIVLNSNNVYHFNRATDSMGDNSVWGTPVIANVLKLLMYRNVLRQAQEAIAREHIVPMRIYYLNKTESFDPMVDFNKVASDFAEQLNKSIRDPNHKVVSPVPVNMLNIGGEGRALLLTPEIEQVQAEILAGMNMPREFIFGGVSYSGSSISLKILENQFITYRLLLNDFIQNFIIKNMAKARKEWVSEKDDDSLIRSKFQDLKMQDDVQQKQVIIQLNGAGKCSNDYMWKVMGFDADNMREAIEKEAVMAVESESKVQMAKVKAELQIQKMQMQAQMELQLFQTQLQKSYTEQYPGVFPQTPTPAEQQQMQAQQEQAQAEAMAQQQGQAQQGQQPQAQPAQQTEPAQQEQQTEAQVPGGGPSDQEIQSVALKLVKLPEESRQRFLGTLPQDVAKKVVEVVSQLDHNKKLEEKAQPDMRPLPEQKPPRRDSLK